MGSDRPGGARAPDPRAGGAQADRLRRAARLAALGHEPGAHPAGHQAAGRGPDRRPAPGAAAGRAARAVCGSRIELADADRGAEDIDFAALDAAARALAVGENTAVFHGWKGAGIAGIAQASTHRAIALGEDCERYPLHVAKAVEALLSAGIEGPYGIALGRLPTRACWRPASTAATRCWSTCARSRAGRWCGRPASRGRWSSACAAATSCSTRARTSRSDTWRTTPDAVQLYLEESFSFRVVTPEAAVPLSP